MKKAEKMDICKIIRKVVGNGVPKNSQSQWFMVMKKSI